jgi:hypothetical protein
MRIDPLWRPLFLPFGATANRAYAEVTADAVRFEFGRLFSREIPPNLVETAFRRPWPWWMGFGWRTDFRGLVGLIGATAGVVEVRFKEPIDSWGPFKCNKIAVSLDDPDGFVAALEQAPAPPAPPARAKRSVPAGKTATRKATSRKAPARKRSRQA